MKVDGYSFYHKIGCPKKVIAPMVDHSELAYRMLCRKYGADLVYTQMFHAGCFIQSEDIRAENFTTCPEDRPLIVQFCGNDKNILLEAAKYVEDRCDAVDINLGCPQGIARRGHYGAFLMDELELLSEIVCTLVKGLRIPVTCKTRIYKDYEKSLRLCETLVQAGASMLTIHGRTIDQKGQFTESCDWETIRKLKNHFQDRVPIISNGGIEHLDDFHRCLQVTKADGVMTSEACVYSEPHTIGYCRRISGILSYIPSSTQTSHAVPYYEDALPLLRRS